MTLDVCFNFPSQGITEVGFNSRLQHRGTDFQVYANNGYLANKADSDLLKLLMTGLLTDDSGVEQVTVSPFSIVIRHSRAIFGEDIKHRVLATLKSSCPVFAEVC
jgi:hypothetical protein